jgi:hypothetical protein
MKPDQWKVIRAEIERNRPRIPWYRGWSFLFKDPVLWIVVALAVFGVCVLFTAGRR